jgi:hypothetical protein
MGGLDGLVEGDLDDRDLAWAFPVVRTRRVDHLVDSLLVEEGLLGLEDHIQQEADPDLAGRSRQEEDLGLEGTLWEEARSLLEDDRLAWVGHRFEGAEDVAEEGGDRDLDPDLGGLVEEDRRLQGLDRAGKRVLGGRWWMGWRVVRGVVDSSRRPS